MADSKPGRKALQAMDAVLAKKPEKDGHALSQATLCLTEFREELTPRNWADATKAQRERLARLNAIISVVMGLHFPIGEAPWDDFALARDRLADLIEELSVTMEPGR